MVIKDLSEKEKETLVKKAFNSILELGKLHGIDILKLDDKFQTFIIMVYQKGIQDFGEESKKLDV